MPQSKHRRGGELRRRRPQPARKSRPPDRIHRGGETGRMAAPAERGRAWSVGWILIALGGVVFLQHLVSHMGFFTLISKGADDIFVGYPTAALLAFGGVMLLSRKGRSGGGR